MTMVCEITNCFDVFCIGHKTLHEQRKHEIAKSRSELKRINVLGGRPMFEGIEDE
jgi:hypothetical protein